jgi:hypothetical protein
LIHCNRKLLQEPSGPFDCLLHHEHESMFHLAASPSDDLINSLLRNTEGLSDAGSSFTAFVECNDFGVAVSFFRRVIGLRGFRKWRIVEHLHDVKSSQPDVEARCGVEPPCMIKTSQTEWSDLMEGITWATLRATWIAGTVL